VMGRVETELVSYGRGLRAKRILVGGDEGQFVLIEGKETLSMDQVALEEALKAWTS